MSQQDDRLMLALDECGLGRGVLLAHVQRRLRVNAAEAMRLMHLRDACFQAITAIRERDRLQRAMADHAVQCPQCQAVALGAALGVAPASVVEDEGTPV